MPSPLPRLRKICLSFPEAHEVEAWGEPTFRVKGKLFAMYAADGNHHGSGRSSVWIKSDKENQAVMLSAQPDRFFKPPYVGPSGWVGVYLDRSPDWDEVRELLRDGWKSIAPKKLLSPTAETKSKVQRPKTKVASRSKVSSPKRGRG